MWARIAQSVKWVDDHGSISNKDTNLFITTPKSTLEHNQSPIKSIQGVNRPECDADHSFKSSAGVKDASSFISTPLCVSEAWRSAQMFFSFYFLLLVRTFKIQFCQINMFLVGPGISFLKASIRSSMILPFIYWRHNLLLKKRLNSRNIALS
jgi:hypothetical protein